LNVTKSFSADTNFGKYFVLVGMNTFSLGGIASSCL